MKYLLDTHAFLWTLFDDERLSKNAAAAIKNPENDIYVSVVTYWEISLKYAIRKIELNGISPDELPQKAMEAGIETVQVSEQQAASFHRLPRLKHKDSFDRLIVWQAINTNITLISKDKELKKYAKHGLSILW
jgi:PIN domain nuclease of toxin-antitoxin system